MKTALHLAALPWLVALVALPVPAFAESVPAFELKLDIDQDGKMDRAVVCRSLVGRPICIFTWQPARRSSIPRAGPISSEKG